MDVQTITMDPNEAREELRNVRKQLHRRADAEYEALAASYEALAQGYPLIDVEVAIQNTQRDTTGRPLLAIARADRKQVKLNWYHGTRLQFDARKNDFASDSLLLDFNVSVRAPGSGWLQGFALVPMIPAHVRESVGRFRDRDVFILWDVEQWSDRSLTAQPPTDPYLLRHVRGTVYAVLAEWDLTPIERLVMQSRRTQ